MQYLKKLALLCLIWSSSLVAEGFAAGTLVKTFFGYVPIEYIEPGDSVLCLDHEGELIKSTVLEVGVGTTYQTITINTGTSSITSDPEQLFCLMPNKKWLSANTLQASDQLLSGSYAPVLIHAVYPANRQVKTYTLTVQKYHNFCVSKDDILVHNMDPVTLFAATTASEIIVPPAVVAAAKIATGVGVFAGIVYSFFWETKDQPKHDERSANNSKNGGSGPCWCGCACGVGCHCNCPCGCGRNNQNNQNITSNPNGVYQDVDYHHPNSRGNNNGGKSPSPRNGQKALDQSIEIEAGGIARIGVSEGQIVILRQTSSRIYHGHVITLNELRSSVAFAGLFEKMIKAGLIDKKGWTLK